MNPCQQEKVLSLERKITIQTMDILCLEKIVKTQVAVTSHKITGLEVGVGNRLTSKEITGLEVGEG